MLVHGELSPRYYVAELKAIDLCMAYWWYPVRSTRCFGEILLKTLNARESRLEWRLFQSCMNVSTAVVSITVYTEISQLGQITRTPERARVSSAVWQI